MLTPSKTRPRDQDLGLKLPLIPILRGVRTDEAVGIAQALIEQGYDCIEVPLNSPQAYKTLEKLREIFPEITLGAGTVVATSQVDDLASIGVNLIIAPNFSPRVVERTMHHGLTAMPGVATPSECFAALELGVQHLKAFPAEMITPTVLRAWTAVLPIEIQIYPVGGIQAQNIRDYLQAGAAGFGFGSSIYKSGDQAAQVASKAAAIKQAWDTAHGRFQT